MVDFPSAITAGKEGCIVIPHLGASTEESEDNCAIMAVEELRDYIENGNIINSVNYPSCDHGPITTKERVCIIHKNITNTIGKYASILGESGINISDMVDKSRGEYAYSLIDIDDEIDNATIAKLKEVEGVIRVRVIRK